MNKDFFNVSMVLITAFCCSACTTNQTDTIKSNATNDMQEFDKGAAKAGHDIQTSIENFGKGTPGKDPAQNHDLKTNANNALTTVGTDVEIAGHAIGNKINSIGKSLDTSFPTKKTAPVKK